MSNMSKYIILSDIHGNLPALEAVVRDINQYTAHLTRQNDRDYAENRDAATIMDDCRLTKKTSENGFGGILLLGDLIDYGMQSNEVVSYIRGELEEQLGAPLVLSIWGNHEHVCMTGRDYNRLSSQRTVDSAQYTASILTGETKVYLETRSNQAGWDTLLLNKTSVYAVHGSMNDPYFGSILPDDVQGDYEEYDLVLSGHSHFPHVFTKFYPCEDEKIRKKKPTVFINPGSVGQPRNRNPFAQYAVWDAMTGQVELRAVMYDVKKSMSLYQGQVDDFYRDRLQWGI